MNRILPVALLVVCAFAVASCETRQPANIFDLRATLADDPDKTIAEINVYRYPFPMVYDLFDTLEHDHWDKLNDKFKCAIIYDHIDQWRCGRKYCPSPAVCEALRRDLSNIQGNTTRDFYEWVVRTTEPDDLRPGVNHFVAAAAYRFIYRGCDDKTLAKVAALIASPRRLEFKWWHGNGVDYIFDEPESWRILLPLARAINERNAVCLAETYLSFMIDWTADVPYAGPEEMPADEMRAFCIEWVESNADYVYFARIGSQEFDGPRPFVVNYCAKYYGAKVEPDFGEPLVALTEAQLEKWSRIQALDAAQQRSLAARSYKLRTADRAAWEAWMKLDVDKQVASLSDD